MIIFGAVLVLTFTVPSEWVLSPNFKLLEISSRPVLRFYGEAMEKKLKAWFPRRQNNGQLGAENKKLNYVTFVLLDVSS